ncbi:Zinc finger, RING-type domain and Zinc finger, RING/FYVE/PHD-type domain-containing protein [Strongyloides ratti]|uniref:Zinc finger, RING-type domain and Zinc finger, RING/FYVE/PHD-type domain-containing protein n=1 Tax=Strongyloides ratti TaxID=34506 RepID=A0A090MXG1_STRRB|nr:Zinc finger, RING-type domain and Zinc finger, RING/FYVE/PHD-type domain-containing protein [Strongyloides ratti]CEF65374.1 Zinc finger, RING-type domain and Zinc finger, RING/FYVE/PHD-type domain-containing protein [Strongyloides ratti]
MMSSLVCCNKCFLTPLEAKDVRFLLLTCLHLICEQCFSKINKFSEFISTKTITCVVCTKNVCFTNIGKGMRETEKELFEDMSTVIKKMETKLLRIAIFQERQRQIWNKKMKERINSNFKILKNKMLEVQKNEVNVDDKEKDVEAIKIKLYKKRKQLQNLKEKCKALRDFNLLTSKNYNAPKSVSLTRSATISLPPE